MTRIVLLAGLSGLITGAVLALTLAPWSLVISCRRVLL